MKKIIIILLFICTPLFAGKVERLGFYNLQELLEDDNLTYKIIKSCVSLNSAIVDIAKKANKKILIQINRSNQRSKLITKTNDFIKSLDLLSTNTIIGNRQIYASSMGEGKTAVEKQKKSNAIEEIKSLSEQILEEVK